MPDISETIQEIAEIGVSNYSADGESTTAMSIKDLILADEYVNAPKAKAASVLHISRFVPGSPVD